MSQLTRSIIDLWKVLTAEPNMGKLLQTVVQTAEIFTSAVYGEIILAGDSWTQLEYQFATEEEITMLKGLQGNLGARIIGVANRDGVKLELCSEKDTRGTSISTRKKIAVLNSISTPLTLEGRPIGELSLYNKPGGFSPEDQEFVNHFLEQVATSMERQLLRTRLGKIETRIQGVFDAIADGILVIDRDGKPVISNHAFRRLMFPEDCQNSALEALLPSLINDNQEEGVCEIALLKPHSQILSGHFVNLRDPLGRLREVIISLRNVTQSKEEERKFLQLVTMIIRRVGKHLEESREKKGLEKRQMKARIRSLVQNLIRLTEIKSGVLRIQRLPVDLEEITEELLPRIQKRLEKRRVSLENTPCTDELLEPLWVDGEMLLVAFHAVFAFHARNLKKGTKLVFSCQNTEKELVFLLRSPRESWRTPPEQQLLVWEKCVDWFIEEENRPFVLDLPFARHIFKAHKGALTLIDAQAGEWIFEIRLAKGM